MTATYPYVDMPVIGLLPLSAGADALSTHVCILGGLHLLFVQWQYLGFQIVLCRPPCVYVPNRLALVSTPKLFLLLEVD